MMNKSIDFISMKRIKKHGLRNVAYALAARSRLWLIHIVIVVMFTYLMAPALTHAIEPVIHLPDSRCDVVILPTDPDADAPFDPIAHPPMNLLELKMGTWNPADASVDIFDGAYNEVGLFVRIEIILEGLVNPPGNIDPIAFNPFAYGDRPVYGFIEIDMDNDFNTGGELDSPRYRYLGNIARFGGLPANSQHRDRTAIQGSDLDQNFLTEPFVERHGEDFHIAILGGNFTANDIDKIDGNTDSVFESGETWNINASWFHRAHGYEPFSFATGGTIAGEYAPLSILRFQHDPVLDVTVLSLVFPLTNDASAMMQSPPQSPQPNNNDPSDQFSVMEALDDLIFSAIVIDKFPSELPEEVLIQRWRTKNAASFLDPTAWDVTALLGSSYLNPDPAGIFFVWNDAYPNVLPGDVNGDGSNNNDDQNEIDDYIYNNDAADGSLDEAVTLSDFASDFSLYDINQDGVVNALDRDQVIEGGECNDDNLCTTDLCDPELGCVHIDAVCDMGESCNLDNGLCEPIPSVEADVLYWTQTLGDRIKRVHLQNKTVKTLIEWPRLDDAVDIALDPVNQKIYWAQSIGNKIRCSDLDGSNAKTILRWPRVDHAVSIAIDTVNHKIYWAQLIGDRIKRADLNGDNVETLLEWPMLDNPIDIAVDPIGGKIYWAQALGDKIRRANLNGNNVETLVERPLVDDAVSIALDPVGGKIFWAQTGGDQIRRADVDGANVETVIQWPLLDDPISMEVDTIARKIYWVQRIGNKIRKYDLQSENIETLLEWPNVDNAVAIILNTAPPIMCPNSCDDIDACTYGECLNGLCVQTKRSCEDSDPTTIDRCHSTQGCSNPSADYDFDGDVDLHDYQDMMNCFTGFGNSQTLQFCLRWDLDGDSDIDIVDFELFARVFAGPADE